MISCGFHNIHDKILSGQKQFEMFPDCFIEIFAELYIEWFDMK